MLVTIDEIGGAAEQLAEGGKLDHHLGADHLGIEPAGHPGA